MDGRKKGNRVGEEVNNEMLLFCTVNSCSNKTASLKKPRDLSVVSVHAQWMHTENVYTASIAFVHTG